MPISLLGLVLCLGLWELLRFCCDKLELELLYPGLRQVLIRITQIGELSMASCNVPDRNFIYGFLDCFSHFRICHFSRSCIPFMSQFDTS